MKKDKISAEATPKVAIAIGTNRQDKHWKNTSISWAEFCGRCSKPIRTDETLSDYMAMPKDEKGEIKDVGGFVCGTLKVNNGSRGRDNIAYMTMLGLDVDNGTPTFWDAFQKIYSCAALLYSSHSSTADSPRYRLIMPFNRRVTIEEYEPIGRRVASSLGIDLFDHTTYQFNRLYYWPSCSSDAEFIFQKQDGHPLDADAILSEYKDWHDESEWPLGSHEDAHERKAWTKLGDPREKDGVIGAFCRAYDIEDAVTTFLPTIYSATAQSSRFTFIDGHAPNGLVCYDHSYAYAWDDSDPANNGRCKNAFDLCRVHLFGKLDKGAKTKEPTKLPSYVAMCDYAVRDVNVRRVMEEDRRQSIEDDFGGIEIDEAEDWHTFLMMDKKGSVTDIRKNRLLIAMNDDALKDVYFNTFYKDFYKAGKPMDDGEYDIIADHLDEAYKLKMNADNIEHRLFVFYRWKRPKNPVKAMIEAEEWDQHERLDTLLIDYLGAEDNQLNRLITRMTFVAAVKRVYEEGCPFDNILTLQGAGGIGKSKIWKMLAGDFFSGDFHMDADENRQKDNLRSSWIIEIAELSGFKKSDIDSGKSLISDQVDVYRPAFARKVQRFDRHSIFIATTNDKKFLRDTTGNRRWWVMPCSGKGKHGRPAKWLDEIKKLRGQIWAEALVRYREGTPTYLDEDSKEWKAMEARREAVHTISDDAQALKDWLSILLPTDWQKDYGINERHRYFYEGHFLDAGKGTMKREVVTCKMIKNECPTIETTSSSKLGDIMDGFADWKRVPHIPTDAVYGRGQGWIYSPSIDEEDDL